MVGERAWAESAMWWHVYPLGFTGAPIREQEATHPPHRLARIEAWLDHVVELGLNGVALGPIFASSTHGYDTTDFLALDPRLGDDGDLDRLVAAAHERGVRVLLDGVFNHVGREHPAFQAALAGGPESALFRLDGGEAQVFEGHEALVALDHSSDATVALVVEVMDHWLRRGIDGWRLDAAYSVPSDFWARVLPAVRERHPHAWLVGEVIHGDYAEIVRASTMDAVTQYELWQGIWHGIADGNLFELEHAIGRHDELLATFVPYTFVGNHDVTRIASAIGVDLVPHALAILMTVAGTPAVYAGDELGMLGVKEQRVGGDDAVRPEMPEAPLDASSLEPDAARILDVTRQLVAIRRRHPWLTRAHTDVVAVANASIVLRTATADASIVTVLAIGDEPERLPAADATEVLAGEGARLDGDVVVLEPHGWAVLGG